MKTTVGSALLCLICMTTSSIVTADDATVYCRNGAVVSVSGPASDVGLAALKSGGSAVDGAIATAFALAVTHPAAGNIGGGGYLLVVPPDRESLVIDFRELAPGAATREMFVDPADRTPHRRVGVPGTVHGLFEAHQKWGKLPWKDLVQPAVALAKEGFPLEKSTASSLNDLLASSDKEQFKELHRVYGKPDGSPWKANETLILPDLSRSLALIAENGPEGFYRGETADKIAAEMKLGKGLISAEDLANYRPIVRQPVRGTYRGYEIISVPPSSSGGTTLIEALNILETFELDAKRETPTNIHRIVEASRRAYRDRARYLGDPEATPSQSSLLTNKEHAREVAKTITDKATPSRDLAGDIELTFESEHTTHLSVVDKDRMAVSLTYTLENSYGSRVVVTGGGFLLNDEMNDFNWLPGTTNDKGRIGTDANLVRPGRRMLSSMCPTIVARDGRPVLVTGSPGGRTIINTVLCLVTNVIDFKMDLRAAVNAPRLHQQWFPDTLRLEPAWEEKFPDLVRELKDRGHKFAPAAKQGDAHSIWIDHATGELTGAADRRIEGKAAGY